MRTDHSVESVPQTQVSPEEVHIGHLQERKEQQGEYTPTAYETVMDTIENTFADNAPFLYEQLQNAQDAGAKEVCISLIDVDERTLLIVADNGAGFNKTGVEVICDKSRKMREHKSSDLTKIGYKGIGSFSFFTVSEKIGVFSNGYAFRFDKKFYEEKKLSAEKEACYIWPITPIPTSCKQEFGHSPDMAFKTTIVMELLPSKIEFVKNSLEELFNSPEPLLYLQSIEKLIIFIDDKKKEFIINNEKISEKIQKKTIAFTANRTKEWLLYTDTVAIPEHIIKEMQGLSARVCPERLQQAKTAVFSAE